MANPEPTIQQLFDLTGKTVLLTGASGWLGGAFARALAEAGASVIASSRDLSRAQAVAAELPSPGGAQHHAVSIDQIDEPTIETGFASAVEQAGLGPDVVEMLQRSRVELPDAMGRILPSLVAA